MILLCYLRGEHYSDVFEAEILDDASVKSLKYEIMRQKRSKFQNFHGFNAPDFVLWKVDLDEGQDLKERVEQLDLRPEDSLASDEKVADLFSSPPDGEKVQVIAAPPPMFDLWCYVRGEHSNNIFKVKINKDKTVDALKDAIMYDLQKANKLRNAVSSSLVLWKVSVPIDNRVKVQVDELDLIQSEALLATDDKLKDIFSESPGTDEISIVIKVPDNNYGALIAAKGNSPSVAKSTEYMRVQTLPAVAIYDGLRPFASSAPPTIAPPVQIFHPVFQQFADVANNPPPKFSRNFLKKVHHLMMSCSTIQTSEQADNSEFVKLFGEILGHTISKGDADGNGADGNGTDGNGPDGTIMVEASDGVHVPILILERERNIGKGEYDPSVHAGFTMRREWTQSGGRVRVRNRCCCPTFIVSAAGPWICILGAVLTDKVIVQRLTDFIWIGNSSTNENLRWYRLACVLMALRTSLDSLKSFYSEVIKAKYYDPDRPTPHPRFYPYPTKFVEDGQEVKFRIVLALENDSRCVTYLAMVEGTKGQLIVVKFVDQYGKAAHEFLAERGYAPKLRYFGRLTGEPVEGDITRMELPTGPAIVPCMMMVVMEEIAATRWPPINEAKRQIREALDQLHEAGYVFGDVRRANVLFDPKGKAKFIDFDWAGRYDQTIESSEPESPTDVEHDSSNYDESFGYYPPIYGEPSEQDSATDVKPSEQDSPIDDLMEVHLHQGENVDFVHYGRSVAFKWVKGRDDLLPIRPEDDLGMLKKLCTCEGEDGGPAGDCPLHGFQGNYSYY